MMRRSPFAHRFGGNHFWPCGLSVLANHYYHGNLGHGGVGFKTRSRKGNGIMETAHFHLGIEYVEGGLGLR